MKKNPDQGITLIELLLVLVIGASLFYIGIRQYISLRDQANVFQLQTNVNTLFNAMAKFYRAQCYSNINPTTGLPIAGTGVLRTTVATPYIIDIANNLVTPGYLTDQIPSNPIISPTAGSNGYVVQFNRYTQVVRMCQTAGSWGPYTSMGCATNTPPKVGTLVLWKAQVAIQLKDVAKKAQYLTLLGGDCLSSMQGNQVLPCPGDPTGDFVVWERIPSASGMSIESTSPTEASLPAVKSFTNMYRTSGVTYLLNTSHSPETEFFYCGG